MSSSETPGSQPELINAAIPLVAGFSLADLPYGECDDDSVDRHAFETRLTELIQAAIIATARASQYFRIARQFLMAARRARDLNQDRDAMAAHLHCALDARWQARRCRSFALLCRRRADCLAAIANGR